MATISHNPSKIKFDVVLSHSNFFAIVFHHGIFTHQLGYNPPNYGYITT